MVLVAFTVAGAVLVGWLGGGRLANLGAVSLRAPWLVVLSIVLQAAVAFADPRFATVLLVSSSIVLLAFLAANYLLPGVAVVALGTLCNAAVVAANGAMPVAREAVLAVNRHPGEVSGRHRLLSPGDPLPWLADVVPLPWLGTVVSAGDVVLAAGVGLLVASLMTRPPARRAAGAAGAD